jgi:hypothetical protein
MFGEYTVESAYLSGTADNIEKKIALTKTMIRFSAGEPVSRECNISAFTRRSTCRIWPKLGHEPERIMGTARVLACDRCPFP